MEVGQVEKLGKPPPSACDAGEAIWIVRLILRRMKVRLDVRVVVRDAGPRVTPVPAELGKQVSEAVSSHRSTAVHVDSERPGLDAVPTDAFCEELFGQRAVLTCGYHPAGHVATVEVERDVEVEEDAALVCGELADIPEQRLEARAQNDHLVLDAPTDLPEGTVVPLQALEDDGLTDEEREQVFQMIDESLADAEAGRVKSLSSVIERLRNKA